MLKRMNSGEGTGGAIVIKKWFLRGSSLYAAAMLCGLLSLHPGHMKVHIDLAWLPDGGHSQTGRSKTRSNTLIARRAVGPVMLGMTLKQAHHALRDVKLELETVADGVEMVAVKRNGRTILRLYTGKETPDGPIPLGAPIKQIAVLDPSFTTAEGVRPGMRFRQVEQRWGKVKKITVGEPERQESAVFTRQPGWITLAVTGDPGLAGRYAGGENVSEGKTTRYVSSAHIESITIDARP